MSSISTKHFSAYINCPYKAYLLIYTTEPGEMNAYENLILKYRRDSQTIFLNHLPVKKYVADILNKGYEYIQDVKINTKEFEFDCPLLVRHEGKSLLGNFYYEPFIFTASNQVTKEQKLELTFLSILLEKIQHKFPEKGTIVDVSGRQHRVEVTKLKKKVENLLTELRTIDKPPPKLILNKHCNYCQFQKFCKAQAQKEDNLSLLDRITVKQIKKLEKKGILTVKQLSFTYKPRRNNRRTLFNFLQTGNTGTCHPDRKGIYPTASFYKEDGH